MEESPQERKARKARNQSLSEKQKKKWRNDANVERKSRIMEAGPLVEGLVTVLMNGQ